MSETRNQSLGVILVFQERGSSFGRFTICLSITAPIFYHPRVSSHGIKTIFQVGHIAIIIEEVAGITLAEV